MVVRGGGEREGDDSVAESPAAAAAAAVSVPVPLPVPVPCTWSVPVHRRMQGG